MLVLSKRIADVTMKETAHSSQIRPESSGCNSAGFLCKYVCYSKLKCSDLFHISMWTTYQLWYPFSQWYFIQQQKYSILAKSNTLFWTHLVFVLCNLYGLKQTEVYRSLLYIYWDNISTPTSGRPCIVCMPQRYSIANKSPDALPVHIWSMWLCDI